MRGRWAINCPACGIARHLGGAAALLGDRAAAQAYYAQALEAAGRLRFRPEVALTHLQLAELLLSESQFSGPWSQVGGRGRETRDLRPEAALEHLDFGIEEFRAMKMRPALEQALRHKGLLKA